MCVLWGLIYRADGIRFPKWWQRWRAGWVGLEGAAAGFLSHSLLQEGHPTAHGTGLCPGGSGMCPARETPHHAWSLRRKAFLPLVQVELPEHQFLPVVSCPVAQHHRAEPGYNSLAPPGFRYLYTSVRFPVSRLFWRLNRPKSLSLSSKEMLQSPSHPCCPHPGPPL